MSTRFALRHMLFCCRIPWMIAAIQKARIKSSGVKTAPISSIAPTMSTTKEPTKYQVGCSAARGACLLAIAWQIGPAMRDQTSRSPSQ